MYTRTYGVVAVLFCLLTIESAVMAAESLLANGDFSQGNTGFLSGYTYSTSSLIPQGTYAVGTNPHSYNIAGASFGDHTPGSSLMMILNGATSPNVVAWQQTVRVTPNTAYDFFAWTASWGNEGSRPYPSVLQLQVNEVNCGGSFTLPMANGTWANMSRTWDSGSSTSATIRIVELSMVSAANDFCLDDMSFTAVPEPATASLLVAGLSAMVARRARRARK